MQDQKPEESRIFVYISRITKICAVLAVFALVLAVVVRMPHGEIGHSENPTTGGLHAGSETAGSTPENTAGSTEATTPAPDTSGPTKPPETPTAVPSTKEADLPEKKLLNGRYRQVYYNGDVYIGDFIDSIRSGQGTYTWANGIIYTGEFADGEPTGNGTYVYPDGTVVPPPTTAPPQTTAPPATNPPATDPPAPTEPPAPPPTEAPVQIEAPKAGFIQAMFEQAIDIPGSGKKIEPPPAGRGPELQFGAVPLSEDIPEPFGYFGDIIFLGDSVTMGFDLFKGKIMFGGQAVLRDATVVAVGSYSVNNALKDVSQSSVHPLHGGKQTRPEDIIAEKEAKYVLICLGLNDVGLMSVEDYVRNYATLIARIKEKSPEKTVVIMSVTPLVQSAQKTRLNNTKIAEANNALLAFAKENSIPFIDYGAAIRDSQNNLYDEFSSDAYCHLTISAYNRIVEYLLYHPLN